MVSPAQRRAVVDWGRQADRVSERRACRALRVHRAMVRYRSVKPDDAPVRRRLHELARDRPSFGVKRLHTMLRRDGLAINHKKTRRLYVEEGLQLKPRRRRRRAATVRQPRAVVTGPNERWAMDFMQDVLATSQAVRVFTLVDVYSRECVALEVARSFSGADVARMLSDAGERRDALPAVIQCDNGTEFTSTALDLWAYWNRVQLDLSRPGKPAGQTGRQQRVRGVQRQPQT
jgi:putative transposase